MLDDAQNTLSMMKLKLLGVDQRLHRGHACVNVQSFFGRVASAKLFRSNDRILLETETSLRTPFSRHKFAAAWSGQHNDNPCFTAVRHTWLLLAFTRSESVARTYTDAPFVKQLYRLFLIAPSQGPSGDVAFGAKLSRSAWIC